MLLASDVGPSGLLRATPGDQPPEFAPQPAGAIDYDYDASRNEVLERYMTTRFRAEEAAYWTWRRGRAPYGSHRSRLTEHLAQSLQRKEARLRRATHCRSEP
jgi:hypothetical protein